MSLIDLQQYLQDIPSAFSTLDFSIVLVIGIILFIGILLLLQGLLRLWQKRLVAAGFRGIGGLFCISIAISALLLGLNMYTYHRLTYESPLVKLTFLQQGPKQYRATLEYLDTGPGERNAQEEYLLTGDEWQLDARVLRWKPVIQLLGFNAVYRLERLNGRYSAVTDEMSQPRSAYSLAHDQGLDLWALTQHLRQWLNWLDAYYGSAAYMPMADNAEFLVVVTQGGLVARPANAAASQALQQW